MRVRRSLSTNVPTATTVDTARPPKLNSTTFVLLVITVLRGLLIQRDSSSHAKRASFATKVLGRSLNVVQMELNRPHWQKVRISALPI